MTRGIPDVRPWRIRLSTGAVHYVDAPTKLLAKLNYQHEHMATPGHIVAIGRPVSWAVEVIADNSGQWCGNACRYATKGNAERSAQDLYSRWFAVREYRVVRTSDRPNRDEATVKGAGHRAQL